MHNVPFPRSYWVLPREFLAGYYPGDIDQQVMQEKLQSLFNYGIRAIINLMEENETNHNGQSFISYRPVWTRLGISTGNKLFYGQVPIQDLSIPTESTMVSVLDLIDSFLAKYLPVYVHCWGGRGRTGTVVGCWLVRHDKTRGKEVLRTIQELRKDEATSYLPSPETAQQIRLVCSWQKGQ